MSVIAALVRMVYLTRKFVSTLISDTDRLNLPYELTEVKVRRRSNETENHLLLPKLLGEEDQGILSVRPTFPEMGPDAFDGDS